MSLTSSFTLDKANQAAVLTLIVGSQSYTITFGSNNITLGSRSALNLVKSDLALHTSYVSNFSNLLLTNFPTVNNYVSAGLPNCFYNFQKQASPNTISMDYQSNGTDAMNLTYNLNSQLTQFAARPKALTVTMQEFFLMVYLLTQFGNQVALN